MFKRGLLTGAIVFAVAGSTAAAASASTLYVSPHGSNANPCSLAHPCQKIAFTVAKAKSGDTVIVEKGIYHQYVLVKGKHLRILGQPGATNDLKGRNNGFNIIGPKASGTQISGFTIENATFEGIVAERVSRLTISNNVVKHNDLGVHASKPTGECAPQGEVPGDCGEGIHLYGGVNHSLVAGNTVTKNSGGILLSDENGPTAQNVISRNNIFGNKADCGITIVGHRPDATKNGVRQPTVAGVFSNTIIGNTVNGNGTKGEGGGILMAVGAPGGAVYNNNIIGNSATGNGLAGVTIHSHDFSQPGKPAPAGDLNGNHIVNNKLTHNGVADKSEAEFGGAAFATGNTVGILVGSSVTKLQGIIIRGNTINNSHFGIFTMNSSKVNAAKNHFHKVAVKVKQV